MKRRNEKIIVNKRCDERIISESNRVYRLCFYFLCGGILIDLLTKFNLYTFNENSAVTLQLFLPETLLLCAVFYVNIFALAKKGIPFGAADYEGEQCPNKRYSAISAVISFLIAFGLWTPRFAFGYWEYGIFSAILFCAAIYLITFVIGFTVLFFSFRLAFHLAKHYANIDTDE